MKVELDASARSRAAESASALGDLASSGESIYGVNTGFGIFADHRIELHQSATLSRNLILSHSVGVGPPLEPALVRAAMLIRANNLAQGFSGVRPALIDLLLGMLNAGVTPYIPSKGSLGASGDLAPLSHLALVFTRGEGEGEGTSGKAWFEGDLLPGAEAMRRAGLMRMQLGLKEGLALNNGASFTTAQLALSLLEVRRCLSANGLAQKLHESAHPTPANQGAGRSRSGQSKDPAAISARLRPVRTFLAHAEEVLEREMNSATDNPLIFNGEALSGGNFHGQPLGLAADCLKRALVEAAHLAHSRLGQTRESTSGGQDPPRDFPTDSALELSARLLGELERCAQPDSILSLPTSADQEDLNPNAWNACRHLAEAAGIYRHIIAIDLLSACHNVPSDALGSLPQDVFPGVERLRSQFASSKDLGSQINRVAQAMLESELD